MHHRHWPEMILFSYRCIRFKVCRSAMPSFASPGCLGYWLWVIDDEIIYKQLKKARIPSLGQRC
jgi:hypothetical protein